MVDNSPFRSLKHNDLTIEGYSRAAVQSYWRIPELKLGFDLGAQPWDFMGTPVWFVSHTHLDHIAALPVYVARRRMMKMEAPVIYLPEHAVDLVQHVLKALSRLDRGRLPCELIPVRPGDGFELSRELIVEAVATRHTVPSLGYIVWERRKKLKPEYQHLTGDQIRDVRLSGVEVSEERRFPLVGYTGDTAPEGLDANPAMYEAKILITEMSFVAPSHRKDKIHKHGHMHLDDFVEREARFQNELVIAAHFSTRYHDKQVQHFVRKALPEMLGGRLHLWL
ncbi:MAG: MBL fold metallo-hydrolase [Planctomycetaceae bacterium]|nr:MBL fold metallo-hydrolase [Planctomycetaceae bacterium]